MVILLLYLAAVFFLIMPRCKVLSITEITFGRALVAAAWSESFLAALSVVLSSEIAALFLTVLFFVFLTSLIEAFKLGISFATSVDF